MRFIVRRRYCTFNDTEVLRVFEALTPLIVRVNVPRGVELVVAMVSVDEPPPGTEPGEKVHEVFAGQPAMPNETVSLKPPEGVTVTSYVDDLPRLIVRFPGETPSVKSGTGAAFTVNVTMVDCVGLPDESMA